MTTNISSALGKAFGTLSASRILTAAATLIICLIVIRLLMKLIRRLVSRSKLDERVQRYVLSGIRLVLYIVAGIITAECLEIDMTSLVALLSVEMCIRDSHSAAGPDTTSSPRSSCPAP